MPCLKTASAASITEATVFVQCLCIGWQPCLPHDSSALATWWQAMLGEELHAAAEE
jgi:hypothetical protein